MLYKYYSARECYCRELCEHISPISHTTLSDYYTISYPDLPGCISEDKSLGNAIYMAQAALAEYIQFLTDKGREIPRPSALHEVVPEGHGDFVNLIRAETKYPVHAHEKNTKKAVAGN